MEAPADFGAAAAPPLACAAAAGAAGRARCQEGGRSLRDTLARESTQPPSIKVSRAWLGRTSRLRVPV